ncbi:MAG: transketolase [Parcubacteria group bacterium Gr01-1014_38]|nr:MAG: transketolase [Parcubacteria group bacterium Gr01-1014_38]
MKALRTARLVETLFAKDIAQRATRDGYGDGLVEVGAKNPNVVVLCGDLKESTRAEWFEKKYPERFVECGISEQNMAAMAAGLALSGKIPFVATYAVFCPGRNWDQVRISICYQNANVKLSGAHAGISVGPDGATHQAMEDIAITRVLPNMTVIAPCDAEETRKAVHAAAEIRGPVYLRFARHKTPVFTTPKTPFRIGKALVLTEGSDAGIIACGPIVYSALEAARQLSEKGIGVRVIDMATVKPLDGATIQKAAWDTGAIVTAEEHQRHGGLGGAVAEALTSQGPVVPQEFVAMPDHFGESGQPDELLAHYGMDADALVAAVHRVIKRKRG